MFSSRCGIQNELTVLNGMMKGVGMKESTAAAINEGGGPTAVHKKANIINHVKLQTGKRLWIESTIPLVVN